MFGSVGKQLSKLYIKNGIDTAYKLKYLSNSWVKKSTNVLGAKTVMELRGISCINLQKHKKKQKERAVVFPRSFWKKVDKFRETYKSLSTTHCLKCRLKRLEMQYIRQQKQ